MSASILDIITAHYSSFTQTGRKLADYILANKAGVQYMSITALAENSKVSEATITRFCRELGVAGYNDFKLALAKLNGSSAIGVLSEDTEPITDDDTIKSLCKKLFTVDITALRETLELVDEVKTSEAIRLLCAADKVYCFGQGSSNVMAKEAWARFSTAASNFIHIEDSHMQAMAASLSQKQDVILFFSYSGSTRDMQDVLLAGKKTGAKIILITHFIASPAASIADVILLCGSKESPLQSGSVAARISQLFIIDYLFYGYCRCNPARFAHNLETTAGIVSSKLL